MKTLLKRGLKRLGRVLLAPKDARTHPSTRAALVNYVAQLQVTARAGMPLPRMQDMGFRIFSQFEEDGYLLFLAAVLELEPKIFIDIGAADGVYSNCANLALNLGWHGLFIDGDPNNVERGKAFYSAHPDAGFYPPVFRQCRVTRENINDVIAEAGFSGEVGVLSIDIDGNDYWIWDALDIVDPVVVIIETHSEFGTQNIVVPYDRDYVYPGKHPDYHGASPVAMTLLGQKKGYRLVGANRFGFNFIFAQNGFFEERVPTVSLDSVLNHTRYQERLALFENIKNFRYVTPDP